MKLLTINHLKVIFDDISGPLVAVHDVNLELREGEILGLIGESGSGKSVTAKAIMQLLDPGKRGSISGEILFSGSNLLDLSEKEMCRVRGQQISMVFQEPMTALNPVMTVGRQLEELITLHKKGNRQDILKVLGEMGISDPEAMMKQYPFELSGGLRQRIVIAMAVLLHPQILIADEPTTALDVTTQAEILELLKRVSAEIGCSVLLITHDLGIIAEIADRVLVMYGGMVVEACPVPELFSTPAHPYSKGLMASRPNHFDGRYYTIPGNVEQTYGAYVGCPYKERCEYSTTRCRENLPPAIHLSGEHMAACWLLEEKGDVR